MTPFDRSKQKAIIFQGRTTGRETKYANLYYEGGWLQGQGGVAMSLVPF